MGLLPVLAGYIFYNRWLDLFPQIEFRTWMWANADLKWFLVGAFTHQGAFSRSSSFLADSVTKSICGISIRCINAPGLWMILLASYLLFWLIVRLTGSTIGAAVAATLWVLSLPVLDGFSWQATMGDRIAVLFGLATVHVALSGMRAVNRRATFLRVAPANVLILIPAIVTYNAKEISWLVLPSLVLLAIALTDDWRLGAIARRASVLVATAAYSVFRIIDTFVLLGESPESQSLDFGGFPAHNANLYVAYLADRLIPDNTSHVLLAVTLVGMLIALARYRHAGKEVRAQIQIMAWAVLSVLGGLILCLFTPSPGPYLLLLPSSFLWIALVALWRSLRPPHGVVRPVAGLGFAGATATVLLVGLNGSYSLYGNLLSWSSNFSRSLPVIAADVPIGASIDFVIGEAPFFAYRFVGEPGERQVDQFIYRRSVILPAAEARMTNVTKPSGSFSGYSIVFGSDLAVTEILHGSQVIYHTLAM